MPVDTAAKRHSALHHLQPSVPRPDGTVAQADRQTLARMYGGILATASVAVAPPAPISTSDLQGILRRVLTGNGLGVTVVTGAGQVTERSSNGIVRVAHDMDTNTLRVVIV